MYFYISKVTPLLILCTPSCHSWRKETFMVVISLSFFVRYPGMKMQRECHHLSTFLFSLWMTTLWGKYIGPDHLSLKSNIIEKIQMVYINFLKKYFRDHLEPKRTILLNCSMNIYIRFLRMLFLMMFKVWNIGDVNHSSKIGILLSLKLVCVIICQEQKPIIT